MTGCIDLEVSLVSHAHGGLVFEALEAIARAWPAEGLRGRLWLTLNLPEPVLEQRVQSRSWPFELQWIRNPVPMGFGANHNQAFVRMRSLGSSPWFIVMNPDIFWPMCAADFWCDLLQSQSYVDVGLVCPTQTDVQGRVQDFARKLPTPCALAQRVLLRLLGLKPSGTATSVESADWVNGACMVWCSNAFEQIGGFDERYFMYCEDTNICLRLQLAGWRMQGADLTVVHDARRNTGRDWRHLSWHIRSMLRLWCSRAYWAYLLRFKVL